MIPPFPNSPPSRSFITSTGSVGSLPLTFGSRFAPAPAQQASVYPEPRAPSDASDAESTSASEWGNVAYSARTNESCKSNNSIENITISGAYLPSTFIVQNDSSISEVWIADGREAITIGDKRRIKVEFVGNIDIEFHGYTYVRLKLTDVQSELRF